MKACLGHRRYSLRGLLTVVLVLVLPLSSALAQGMTPADKLGLAKNLCNVAEKRVSDARNDCECVLLEESLSLIKEALLHTSEVVAEAKQTGDTELLRKAYGMAQTIGEVLLLMGEGCIDCSRKTLDILGCCCNCDVAEKSVESANEAASLAAAAADDAAEANDADLAQQAYDAAHAVGEAIASLAELFSYCTMAGTDIAVVNCCGRHAAMLQEMGIRNEQTMEKGIIAGAVPPPGKPERPPGDDEPPIRDHEQPPASPV